MNPKIFLVCLWIAFGTPAFDAYEVKILFQESANCATAKQTVKNVLVAPMFYICAYNKTTRLKVKQWTLDNDQDTLHGAARVKFQGNPNEVDYGLYMLVLRKGLLRQNENHATNPRIVEPALPYNRTWKFDAIAGRGFDFSKMYYDSPFALRVEISEVQKTGQEKQLKVYDLRSCADTGKFIANEGYYQLHESGEWWPTYYDPKNSLIYY